MKTLPRSGLFARSTNASLRTQTLLFVLPVPSLGFSYFTRYLGRFDTDIEKDIVPENKTTEYDRPRDRREGLRRLFLYSALTREILFSAGDDMTDPNDPDLRDLLRGYFTKVGKRLTTVEQPGPIQWEVNGEEIPPEALVCMAHFLY